MYKIHRHTCGIWAVIRRKKHSLFWCFLFVFLSVVSPTLTLFRCFIAIFHFFRLEDPESIFWRYFLSHFLFFTFTKSSNRIDMLPANVPKSGFYFHHCWFNKNGFFFYFLSPAGRLAGRCQLQKVDFFISKDVKNIILPSNNTSITTSQLKKSALRMQGYICYENSFDFDGFFPKQQRRCEELPVATKI